MSHSILCRTNLAPQTHSFVVIIDGVSVGRAIIQHASTILGALTMKSEENSITD